MKYIYRSCKIDISEVAEWEAMSASKVLLLVWTYVTDLKASHLNKSDMIILHNVNYSLEV